MLSHTLFLYLFHTWRKIYNLKFKRQQNVCIDSKPASTVVQSAFCRTGTTVRVMWSNSSVTWSQKHTEKLQLRVSFKNWLPDPEEKSRSDVSPGFRVECQSLKNCLMPWLRQWAKCSSQVIHWYISDSLPQQNTMMQHLFSFDSSNSNNINIICFFLLPRFGSSTGFSFDIHVVC